MQNPSGDTLQARNKDLPVNVGLGMTRHLLTHTVCMLPVHKKCAPSAHKRICQEAALADNYVQFKDVIKDNTLKQMQKLLWQIGEDPNLETPKKLAESTG